MHFIQEGLMPLDVIPFSLGTCTLHRNSMLLCTAECEPILSGSEWSVSNAREFKSLYFSNQMI